MQDLLDRVQAGDAIFARPRPKTLKAFNGRLFTSFRDLIPTAHISDDEPIECAEPVDFASEHRCFVLRGDPIDVRHYDGDPLVFPDPEVIRQAVAAYQNGPSAYAIDFGIIAEGSTIVVEVNDSYAVGSYGLAPIQYADFISARWDEPKEISTPPAVGHSE